MLLTIFCWVALIFFFAASFYKAYTYAKLPMHGRQDLYPIPLDTNERNKYGGSYYEDDKWYEKPITRNHVGMIIDMLGEMLFIKKLFVNQNSLWWISYSLHLGIYAALAWTVLLFVGVFVDPTHVFGMIVYFLTTVAGIVAGVLMTIGAAGLLLKRLLKPEFKNYTTPQEYFNLIFLLCVSATGLLVWFGDMQFEYGRNIARAMVSFSPLADFYGGSVPTLLTVHIILLGAVMIYIPLTKMSHYVGKFFTFHNVIWDNEPNLPGSKVESKIIEQAKDPKPSNQWSAPHYQPAPTPTEEAKQ